MPDSYIPPFKGGQGRSPEDITSTAGVLSVIVLCLGIWAVIWWCFA